MAHEQSHEWCDMMVNMINENTARGISIVFPLHGYTAVVQVQCVNRINSSLPRSWLFMPALLSSRSLLYLSNSNPSLPDTQAFLATVSRSREHAAYEEHSEKVAYCGMDGVPARHGREEMWRLGFC